MQRLNNPEPASMTPEQKRVHDAIVAGPRGRVSGPLAVWLHRPELADRAQRLGEYCRYGSSLPPILSELAILVTARVWGSEFEWLAHKAIALKAGLPETVVEAIRSRATPRFADEAQAVVHDFALALHTARRVPDALYSRAVAALGEPAVVDLTALLGYYTLVSMTINVFRVEPPAGKPTELD
jgi:4-carboxymuconolactone decarboxylase